MIGFGLALAGLLMLVEKAGYVTNAWIGCIVPALLVLVGVIFLLKGFCKCCHK